MPSRWILLALAVTASSASAHYHMLLPDRPSVKSGEAVTVTYQFGHPFEHELSDAVAPAHAFVIQPGGKKVELTDWKADAVNTGEKPAKVFRIAYTPEVRGDHTIVYVSPPIWDAEAKQFHRDQTKVVVHVQVEKGWEAEAGGFELQPLTRPYGLRPGTSFRIATDVDRHEPAPKIEAERYNPRPPKDLPANELITQSCRTDRQGTAAVTLFEPGWWCVTATRPRAIERRTWQGKEYPVTERSTLWVFVESEKAGR